MHRPVRKCKVAEERLIGAAENSVRAANAPSIPKDSSSCRSTGSAHDPWNWFGLSLFRTRRASGGFLANVVARFPGIDLFKIIPAYSAVLVEVEASMIARPRGFRQWARVP